MTQSGKSFLNSEEQRKDIASKMIGTPTSQREAFQELKTAEDIKNAQVQTPEGTNQQKTIKVDLTKGGVLDEEGYTVSQQDGLTVRTKVGKVNKAQGKAAERPELEELAKKTEDIEVEKEGFLKRVGDTFIHEMAELTDSKLGKFLQKTPFTGPMIGLSAALSDKRENKLENEVFLSDGKIITSAPEIQDPDMLVDMKDLAQNVLIEYSVNGNVVTAKQIKEAYPQYKNISDQILDDYVGGAIGAYINGQPIDREIVGNNYSSMSMMEGYTAERQQEIDMFTDEDIMTYGISEDLLEQINKDENAGKLIEAYRTVKRYVEGLKNQGISLSDASDRKIANTYRNQTLQYDGIMSLDEAMNVIENYDPKRLQTLMGAITTRYNNKINREINEAKFAENNEKLYNILQDCHATAQFIDESFEEATDQFLEYVAEQKQIEPTALKLTPASRIGDFVTKFISGNMWIDNDGNYRDIQGEVVFHKNPDGSYTDSKGRTVQELTGLQKGWLRNNVNALTSVLEGATDIVEGVGMETIEPGQGYAIQALAGTISSVVNTLMVTKGQKFMALSSTPGFIGRWVDGIFQAGLEIGGDTLLGLFNIAQLTDTYTDESKEALKEIGGLLLVSSLSKGIGKSETYKNIKKAAKKVWDKHADMYLQVKGNSELKENIKNPKGTQKLEDKTNMRDVVDTEGKTIGEIETEVKDKSAPKQEGTTEPKVTEKGTKTEPKTETKEREVVDVTPIKDKIGYSLQINKVVAQRMVEEFRNELSKLTRESDSKQAIYDVLSTNPKLEPIKDALFGKADTILDSFIKASTSILQTVGKTVRNFTKDTITGKRAEQKLLKKAYKKMGKNGAGLSESSIKTIENNSKLSQLGKIFHELINSKGERRQNIKNIEKYVKERVSEMWEEEARNIQKALEKAKDMAHEFYGRLTTDKKIRFGRFFTGENGIKTVIEQRLAPYIQIRQIDGKIYVQIIPGASGYNKVVAGLIKRFAKEYNELVEDGRISEKDIESLGDILKKRGKSKDMTVANTGNHLKQALQNYLSKTGEANEWLKAEKAYDAIHDLYNMFTGLYKDKVGGRGKDNEQKPSANKIVKFLEGLSEEQIDIIEEYLPGTRETLDLLKNGAPIVEGFADRYTKGKQIETFLGQKGKGGMDMWGKAIVINLVDLASWMHNSTLGLVVTGATLGGLFLKGGLKTVGRVNNILKNKKLRKLLQTALDGDKEAQEQLKEQTEAIQQGVKKVNDAIASVIEKRTRTPSEEPPMPPRPTRTPRGPERNQEQQGPNRREYDTSVPNREEYDPNAPIFRNGEENQQPFEQRDNDMVISEKEQLPEEQQKRLTDERQYLGYEEDPEAQLEQAMADLEVYIKDTLQTLKDLIDKDDTDDEGDGGNGGNGPKKPTDPTDPDTKEAIDTIDDFIKFVEGNSPVEKSQGEDKPDFKTRSNESLNKLLDKDGNLKEGVPPEYEEEILNELYERQLKKDTVSDNIKDQNAIIRRINEELDKVADHKRKDIEADEFEMDIRQVRGVDQHKAYDIFTDIVDGKIQETDITQKKTIYEDNKEAAERIKKRTGEEITPTKSASKTSSLDVRNTKPDTPGKLKSLKTQLEKKKKSLPTAKTYKTMKKRQEEVAKLEEEVNRLEKLFNKEEKQQEWIDREFDEMDVEAYDVIMEGIAEEISKEEGKESSEVDDLTFTNKNREKTQTQPSGEEKSETKEIETEEVSEGEEITVFEEMTLRELLQSDDPEAQDEIKARKSELKVNPKKLYQEMKNALKDEELTSEEAEFYDDVVRKTRAETDMSEKHEDMLIDINNEIWKKTHDGLLF